jgi:hypothetical protein
MPRYNNIGLSFNHEQYELLQRLKFKLQEKYRKETGVEVKITTIAAINYAIQQAVNLLK